MCQAVTADWDVWSINGRWTTRRLVPGGKGHPRMAAMPGDVWRYFIRQHKVNRRRESFSDWTCSPAAGSISCAKVMNSSWPLHLELGQTASLCVCVRACVCVYACVQLCVHACIHTWTQHLTCQLARIIIITPGLIRIPDINTWSTGYV